MHAAHTNAGLQESCMDFTSFEAHNAQIYESALLIVQHKYHI